MKLSPHSLMMVPVCLLLSLAGLANAQNPPSHRPVSGKELDPNTAESQLRARLGQPQRMNKFEEFLGNLLKDMAPENLSAEERQKLLDLAAKQQKEGKLDLTDKQIAKLLEQNPGLKKANLTDEEKQKLIELWGKQQQGKPLDLHDKTVAHIVEKMNGLKPGDLSEDDLKGLEKISQQQKQGQPLNLDDPVINKVVKKLLEGKKDDLGLDKNQVEDIWDKYATKPAPIQNGDRPPYNWTPDQKGSVVNPPPPPFPPPHGGPGQPGTPPFPNQSARPPADQTGWFGQQVMKVADSLGLGPAVKDKLADAGKNSVKNGDNGKSWNLSDYFPADKINDAGSFVSKFKLPSMPDVGPVSPQVPNAPTGPVGLTMGGTDGLLNVLVVVVVVVIAGIVAWKLMSLKQGQAEKAEDGWQLGAWPVHPSAVRTRADLVKAFEYLAVLLLGPKARTRHHLELAQELGRHSKSADTRRSEAARTLAYLYEIARYTPEEETLPPKELATAQHELSFLAGAALA